MIGYNSPRSDTSTKRRTIILGFMTEQTALTPRRRRLVTGSVGRHRIGEGGGHPIDERTQGAHSGAPGEVARALRLSIFCTSC